MKTTSLLLLTAAILLPGCSTLSDPSMGKRNRQPINVLPVLVTQQPAPARVPVAPVAQPAKLQAPEAIAVNALMQEQPAYRAPAERTFRVFFPAGGTTFELRPGMAAEMLPLARAAARVEVRGRTDGDHPSDTDERVAMQRAVSARSLLVKSGVDPRMIYVQYESAGDYLGDNTTAFGKSQNRRVEIRLLLP